MNEKVGDGSGVISDGELSRNYLDSHLEPTPEGFDVSAQWDYFDKKNGENLTYEQEGTIETLRDDLRITIAYTSLRYAQSPRNVVECVGGSFPDTDEWELGRWRLLKSFQIVRKNMDGSVTTLCLQDILPEGFSVVFAPSGSNRQACASFKYKCISIYGDITKPTSILALLHEAGHITDDVRHADTAYGRRVDVAHRNAQNGHLSPEDAATLLRSERSAWAHGLSKLRPFLETKPSTQWISLEDVRKHVHLMALRGYSDKIRRNNPDIFTDNNEENEDVSTGE